MAVGNVKPRDFQEEQLMKPKALQVFCGVLALLLCFSGCEESESKTTSAPEGTASALTQSTVTKRIDTSLEGISTGSVIVPLGHENGMWVVAENSKYRMLIDPATANLQVENKTTHALWCSGMDETIFNHHFGGWEEEWQKEMASTLLFSYINTSGREVYLNSYAHSVKDGNYALYGLENGVRVAYQMGENDDHYLVPQVITQEWMDRITQGMSELDAFKLTSYYEPCAYDKLVDDETALKTIQNEYKNFGPGCVYYKLDTNAKTIKQQMYQEYLKDTIPNFDTLQEIYAAAGYSFTAPDLVCLAVPIDFTLTESGITVSLNLSSLGYHREGFEFNTLELLQNCGVLTQSGDQTRWEVGENGVIITNDDTETVTITIAL